MTSGRAVPELLAQLGTAASMEDELRQTLQRLLAITGAVAGALAFPSDGSATTMLVTAARSGSPDGLDDWLRQRLSAPRPRGLRLARVEPPGVGRSLMELRAVLGSRRGVGGDLLLIGRLSRASLPAALPQELGAALARVWRLHRGARETRALLKAGRAVTASLDVQETIRVILAEARAVLGAASCSLLTLDPRTCELVGAASLDLPAQIAGQIRLKPGEGIGGLAFSERRPIQSEDLYRDSRARYPHLARATGYRSILSAPLLVCDRAIGVLSVFRRDVHRFSAQEEELLLALAEQAAIALEHARLYEQLEGMVADRTRELETQRRFVEVVLETLPLGVFVIDADLKVVRANREGERVLGRGDSRGRPLDELVPSPRRASVRALLSDARGERRVSVIEEDMVIGEETKILRLTAAPIEPGLEHLVLLVEDVTMAKRLERQMLLNERLTTAGRLAAGVAHELNNPLATIAGCSESLLARTREGGLAHAPEMDDFRHYLGLIEEESYRCKEITGSLLQFVRDPGSRRAPTDLNALTLKTIDLLSHQARFGGRRFATELDPELPPVTANEGQLRQVFLGIAANALDAMGPDGTLTIRSRRRRHEVEVEFDDQGPGIPDDIIGRIFDPFFTTKPPGQGTGLGLAIAQGIVTDHGGRLEVTSRVGKGSIFRVVLPV